MFFLASLLCFGAVVEARALESPALRWEYWTRRPLGNIRADPGSFWPLDPAGAGLPGAAPAGLSRGATDSTLRLLPLQAFAAVAKSDRPVLWPEEDGIRLGEHPIAAASGGLDLRLRSGCFVRGRLLLSARSGGPWAGRTEELFLAGSGARHAVVVGRSELRWGGGPQGSLLLGRSALARWQIRWRTVRALTLPGPARRAGTWKGEAFLALLDDPHRAIPRPLLHGQRLAWEPTSWLELAGTRTILFGGRGRTRRLTGEDLWMILTGRGENIVGERPPRDSDQKASFEVRTHFPWLKGRLGGIDGLEGYWEYAGEDWLRAPLPSAVAHNFGGALVYRGWTGWFDFAETVTGKNRWYRHTVYGDAYEYRGDPLGIPMGADARSSWLGLWSPEGPARLHLSRTEQTLGVYSGNREHRVLWSAAARLQISPGWLLECGLSHGRKIGPGSEPLAPPLMRDLAVLRLTAEGFGHASAP